MTNIITLSLIYLLICDTKVKNGRKQNLLRSAIRSIKINYDGDKVTIKIVENIRTNKKKSMTDISFPW